MFLEGRPSSSLSPDPFVRRVSASDDYSDAPGYVYVHGDAIRVEDSTQRLSTDHAEDVEGLRGNVSILGRHSGRREDIRRTELSTKRC